MGDPLFHDDKRHRQMSDDPQIRAKVLHSQWIKFAVGCIALSLIAAIWLTWRLG
jgi:hypothetical protein